MKARTILRAFALLFLFILLLEFIFQRAYPGWTFNTAKLVILNKVITYFAFFGLFLCTVIMLKVPRILAIVFSLILTLLFFVASCSAVFPIDTLSQPRDMQTLASYPDGKKLIIRQYEHAKTKEQIRDTVLIKDLLIFRRIYSSSIAASAQSPTKR